LTSVLHFLYYHLVKSSGTLLWHEEIMAAEEEASKASSVRTANGDAQETTPLLHQVNSRGERKWPKSVAYLVLLTGFLVSLSFGVTQVP